MPVQVASKRGATNLSYILFVLSKNLKKLRCGTAIYLKYP